MFNWIKQPREGAVITGRGPGSGTGQPLSDEDALAILDERVEESSDKDKNPDIGVVIDPDKAIASSEREPKKFWMEPIAEPMFDPSPYTDLGGYYTKARERFAPEVPRCIVITDKLETPLRSILKCSYSSRPSCAPHSLWVKLLLDEELIDVDLAPERISAEATLLDLLKLRNR
jgi:hypothetical protein